LYQGNVTSGLIERIDGTTGLAEGNFTMAPVGPIADLAFGPTKLYVTCDGGGGVARFDALTGAADGFLIAPGASYWGILVDSGNLYVANNTTPTLRTFNATSGAFISDFALGGSVFDIIAMPIPEPSGAIMLALGGCAMLRRRKI
ncbi:MAG: PEP-CTERM sorting domain-containing protein, partial [Tepidisphaeraceae bacterium]